MTISLDFLLLLLFHLQVLRSEYTREERLIPGNSLLNQVIEEGVHMMAEQDALEVEESITQEFERRSKLWEQLLAKGGPQDVAAETLRALGIYGGAQGIWVDKGRTDQIAGQRSGITVSLTHSGKSYPDDWSDEGVLYHYPATQRPQGRDAGEIEATKNAQRLGLPVFVITHTNHSRRNVRVGWVMEWDDSAKQFLVLFDESFSKKNPPPYKTIEEIEARIPFELFGREERRKHTRIGRTNQRRFQFQVFKRYGPSCAVCRLSIPTLLQAAHIVPKEHKGSDDPRNGLVLCANHHLAFDAHLFGIKPETLELCYQYPDMSAEQLHITVKDLHSLPALPHEDAIKWRYDLWKLSKE